MNSTSAQRYRAICEASPDAIVLVDADGEITYANERVADLFGYEPNELLGEQVELLVPEPARDGHPDLRDAYFADPTPRAMGADVDLSARCKDGTTLPVDVSLSPIRTDGELEVMAAIRDISERETLRTTYRTILQAVPDAVVVADADTGEIVDVNDQVTDLVGYPQAELLGTPQTKLHPSGEEDRYRELFERHAASGSEIVTRLPDGSDLYVETRDGERIPVEINARVFELGDRRRIVGVFRDVTARREHERQLRDLSEETRTLMEATDRREVARMVAEAADRILGYTSTVVRLASDDGDLHPAAVTEQARERLGDRPDYPADGGTPVARAYENGESLVYEDLHTLSDGYDRGHARSAMYLPIGGYGVLSVVDTAVGAFDQSDVEIASILASNAETAFARLAYERELRRQNERLEEFTAVVSHDLRNPLNVARGWVDGAAEDLDRDDLRRALEALDRMDEIIDDTLTLARQGRTVDEVDRLDVRSVAEDCWEMVSTDEARLEIADDLAIPADRSRIQHVFENLFRNAVEHGGQTITVGRLDEGGFYVEDDGPGIPEARRDDVFEPGYTTATDGTGFGLTIVKRIADAHGWDVRVTVGDAGGARFEFTGVESDSSPIGASSEWG